MERAIANMNTANGALISRIVCLVKGQFTHHAPVLIAQLWPGEIPIGWRGCIFNAQEMSIEIGQIFETNLMTDCGNFLVCCLKQWTSLTDPNARYKFGETAAC